MAWYDQGNKQVDSCASWYWFIYPWSKRGKEEEISGSGGPEEEERLIEAEDGIRGIQRGWILVQFGFV